MQCLLWRYIKTTVSDDIYTKIGTIKRRLAASGICHGLGYGDNFHGFSI